MSSCKLATTGDGYYEWDGIHTDVYPTNGTIDGNTIYNIDQANGHPGGGGTSTGLHIEAGSFGWIVKNNVIHDIGYGGILNNQQKGSGTPNQYLSNTIYRTGNVGIEVRWGYATVENNIIDNAASVQLYVRSQAIAAGGITIDYNDYWDASGGSKVGSWNEGPTTGFSNWKSACKCDTHSINADPLFTNPLSDFSLQSSSPALTSGLNGAHMGAIGPASPRSDLQPPTGWINIVSKISGQCLSDPASSMSNGTDIIQWACNNSDDQKWQLTPVAGGYEITNSKSGLQLDVTGGPGATQDGVQLCQWPYWGGANEIFQVNSASDGFYTISPISNPSECLDVPTWSGSNWGQNAGLVVQQWSCWGGDMQKWSLIPAQ